MEKLTVKQAKEQGFEYFGFDSESWQTLQNIDEIEPIDFERKPYLFDTEEQKIGIDKDEVKECIASMVTDQYYDQSGNEDEGDAEMYEELLKVIPESALQHICEVLNEHFSNNHKWRKLTNIELIP